MTTRTEALAFHAWTIMSKSAGIFYSVSFQLIRQEVEARITTNTIEIFHRGKLVAAHMRGASTHRLTMIVDHMASSHQALPRPEP